MKRVHRRWHRIAWLLAAAAMAAGLGLGTGSGATVLANPDWPAALSASVSAEGP